MQIAINTHYVCHFTVQHSKTIDLYGLKRLKSNNHDNILKDIK